MWPLPQCPYCGAQFDDLASALTHLDQHPPLDLPITPTLLPPDSITATPAITESDDPTPQWIDDAG